jgi:lipooligosaccharide transport system permease protein
MAVALRVLVTEIVSFRRNWRGWIMSSLGNPIAFLAAMGLGLGSLVDEGAGSASLQVGYVAFVASGLMAASAMQNGFGEGAWPVMAGLKWRKNYQAMMVTPVRPGDLLAGRLLWGTLNFGVNLLVYALVAVAFGALALRPALVAILPALLTGVAFQAISTGYTASLTSDTGLTNAYRFGVMPLFLFSGTFFPVSQLPGFLEAVAVATPLFHGVELTRKLALPELGSPSVSTMPLWVHVTYLVVMLVVGAAWAARRLRQRLYA